MNDDLDMLEKRIEETREWTRKADTASWIALIAASTALIVSILHLLPILIYILR